MNAPQLPGSRHREYALARLGRDGDVGRDKKFTWAGVGQAFRDPKVYLYALCYHTTILPA